MSSRSSDEFHDHIRENLVIHASAWPSCGGNIRRPSICYGLTISGCIQILCITLVRPVGGTLGDQIDYHLKVVLLRQRNQEVKIGKIIFSRYFLDGIPDSPQLYAIETHRLHMSDVPLPRRSHRKRRPKILSSVQHTPYPLTAPAVIPLTKYFCMKNPMMIMGTMVIVAAALHFPQSTDTAPT